MPTPTELQFDGRLTNISQQYINEEYIGDLVMPPVAVQKKTGIFKTYDKDERFTVPETLVGAKTTPNEVEWSTGSDTFTCADNGLEEFLSQEEVDNADAPINAQSDTVEFVTNLVMLAKEKAIADFVFNAANYGSSNEVDIAAAWATLSSSTVLSDLETGMDACFKQPNILVMGLPTWRAASRSAELLAAVKGTLNPQNLNQGGVVMPAASQAELAAYLGLDAVLVGAARINTARKGQAASYARVWDGTTATKGGAALLRVKSSSVRDAVWAANFAWKLRQAFTYPSTRGAFGGSVYRIVESYVLKLIADDVGYLFKDCLVT